MKRKRNLRIINAEKPVESQVHSQDQIDELRVLLVGWLEDLVQTLYHLGGIEIPLVLAAFKAMLIESLNGVFDVHKVNLNARNVNYSSLQISAFQRSRQTTYARASFAEYAASWLFDKR